MKMSQVTSKTNLAKPGITNTSYVLVNYAEGNNAPVTRKVTLEELGRAIAAELQLCSYNDNWHRIFRLAPEIEDNEFVRYNDAVVGCVDTSVDLLDKQGHDTLATFYQCYVNNDGMLATPTSSNMGYYKNPIVCYEVASGSSDIILTTVRGQKLVQIPFDTPVASSESEE